MKWLTTLACIGCGFVFVQAQAPPLPTALTDYVAKPDDSYRWVKSADSVAMPKATVHTLRLTSQTWQGEVWEHDLQFVVPTGVPAGGTVLLWNQGGGVNAAGSAMAVALAEKAQVPVAFLYGVPKQPLFDGKREDALIAETFVKYLETGDANWPLLFPMVKSVVRGMDAVQAFAQTELKADVTGFVVTGASKRGWTAWLTAATGDPRVKAIAPMVIDTLNFPEQMKKQVASFGEPSQMIADYTRRGLVPIPDTPRAQALWKMVDPYTYRAKLTLPKLIILGTNDPYWPLDAVTAYWSDLPDEKYLLSVPNAGHDLREKDKDGNRQLIPERAVNTLAAFAKVQARGAELDLKMPAQPVATVAVHEQRTQLTVPITANTYNLWTADSDTADFRQARWNSQAEEALTGIRIVRITTTFEVPAPAYKSGVNVRAAFIEATYKFGDLSFTLSTPVVLVAAASS